jgi:hypothetical protein
LRLRFNEKEKRNDIEIYSYYVGSDGADVKHGAYVEVIRGGETLIWKIYRDGLEGSGVSREYHEDGTIRSDR